MTTEIEKQFFDTFRIEPKCETRDEYHKHECYGMVDCDECASAIYPRITDRIWLELVRIYASCNIFLLRKNMEDFKYDILTALIERPYEYRKQIKELFKEG